MWFKATLLSLLLVAAAARAEVSPAPTETPVQVTLTAAVAVTMRKPALSMAEGTAFVAATNVSLCAELARLDGGPLSVALAQAVSRRVAVRLLLDPADYATRLQGRRLSALGAVVRWRVLAGHPDRRLLAEGRRLLRWKAGQETLRQDGDAAFFNGRFEGHWSQAKETLAEAQNLDDDLHALPDPRDKVPRIIRRKESAGE